MRTYYHHIQHESDLRIARENFLLPLDSKDITMESIHRFFVGFGDIQDNEVSPRYASYGTLRLSRLNLWAKIFLHRFRFDQVNRQYSEYFAQFYGPIMFFFGILPVFLSAFQVALARSKSPCTQVKPADRILMDGWPCKRRVCDSLYICCVSVL